MPLRPSGRHLATLHRLGGIFGADDSTYERIRPMKAPSKASESRITSIHAKKAAGLDRVRELLRSLPPEVSVNLDHSELKTGVAIVNKKKPPGKAVIQSPGDGLYCWNGSNAMTEAVVVVKIAGLANG